MEGTEGSNLKDASLGEWFQATADLGQFTPHQKGCETLKQRRRYRPELSHHGRVIEYRRRKIRSEGLEKAKQAT